MHLMYGSRSPVYIGGYQHFIHLNKMAKLNVEYTP